MQQLQPEIVTLRPENTGGIEMSFVRKMIGIPNPHVAGSHERPLRAELETLVWNNPESDAKAGEKVQYVVMSGININAVDIHPILAMLTGHADTIIGVTHPDAPQSKIVPHNSPFDDEKSFANSGFTVLRTIETLYEDGSLDRKSPLTVVGHSTGSAVLTEAIAQDIGEANANNRPRLIHQAVLLAPGGMLDIGGKEIIKGVTATQSTYWQEFFDMQVNALRSLFKNPKKLANALSDSMEPGSILEEITHAVNTWRRMGKNLKGMRNWPKDAEWKAIGGGHKIFEVMENLLRVPRVQFLDELLAHFHRLWIDQPGWPHLSPKSAAFKRSRENVVHNVTQGARAGISKTPMIVWFGENDKVIPPEKFLTVEDNGFISSTTDRNEQIIRKEDRMLKRIKAAFPNNTDNVHVLLGKESGSHHYSPRTNASALELYFLRYLYPQKQPEIRTIYYGSGNQAKQS